MKLTEAQVSEFLENGSIKIGENEFDTECLIPRAEFIPVKEENHGINGQLDYAVILNMNINEDLTDQRIAREFVNRIQKVRQKERFNINVRLA